MEEQCGRLSSKIYLSIGSKIVLIQNVLNIGLSNGSVGIIKDMACIDGSLPLALPVLVRDNFGNLRIGINFFPRDESRKG